MISKPYWWREGGHGWAQFYRQEGAMARFRDIKTLQKFASIHASIHNHFNLDRHLTKREDFKKNRSAALAEWRQLAA
jgi:putative transposase